MTAVASAFETLLESDRADFSFQSNDDSFRSGTLEERQGQLCQALLRKLEEDSARNDQNIRQVLGTQSVSDVTPLLIQLLTSRVERDALLPATQDAEANEEVMENSTSAMTLTPQALSASALYAKLLSYPGALGSGLVDLEALTALNAVVRRWTVECCGREDQVSNSSSARRRAQPSSPVNSPPKKKSRRRPPPSLIIDSEDEGEGFVIRQQSLLQTGLRVTLSLCHVPQQREFCSWSSEAREVLLDSIAAGFGTAAAFRSLNSICPEIVQEASIAMKNCLSGSSSKSQKHETLVVLLRGLLNLLQLKEILPNGERGKLDAHAAASQVLQSLIECTVSGPASPVNPSNQLTPTKGTRNRLGLGRTPVSIAKTPKSQRKRRSSLEGKTPMTSPALKSRRQSAANFVPNSPIAQLNPILKLFVGMLQKLSCSPGLERAVARSPTVETVQKSIGALPLAERTHFLRYLLKLSNSKISMHRLVAAELIGSILQQDWLSTHDEDVVGISKGLPPTIVESPGSNVGMPLPSALWKALQSRLMDKIAAVRARAATSMEESARVHPENIDEFVLFSLRKRALRDETATVRKAATLAMTQVLLAQKDFMSEHHLSALYDLCQDSSLLTRKAAAESLTKLLKAYVDHPLGSMIEEAWSTCVLPMVLDEESGPKAVMAMDEIVIQPILENSNSQQNVAWRILSHVGSSSSQQGGSKGAALALQATLKQLALEDYGRIQNKLLERVTRVACKSFDEECSESQVVGAWCLLEALLSQSKNVNEIVDIINESNGGLPFFVNAWKRMVLKQSNSSVVWMRSTLRSCLIVVSKLAPGLSKDEAEECRKSLQDELKRYSMPPDLIGTVVDATVAVSNLSTRNETRKLCKSWIESLMSTCEETLARFVREISEAADTTSISSFEETRIVRALFTVGELSMVGFRPDDDEGQTRKDDDSDLLRGLHVKPSSILRELVQTMLSNCLLGPAKIQNPVSLRAHAFTVMGKFCLRDEKLAKSSLNIFARELHASVGNPCPSVQSNALLVLGDLCVRYTNMVDRYLPVMASCLQAGSTNPETNFLSARYAGASIVRKHAILLLSSLLLQDYIKWRGLLFHRFLVAYSDEDEGVAQLAESVLSGPLWQRNQKLFFNNFVEALFVLNKCTAHPIYVAATSHGDGGSGIAVGFDGINLNGAVGRARRRRMYDFLLSKLTDEDKIGVTARLAKEVLGSAANSEGDLGRVCELSSNQERPQLESAWNVMADAFYILTSKAIKVGKVQEEDCVEDPNVPNPARQVTVAKSRLMSKISRKHLIEIVFPILCNLKAKLQSSCSPLLKDLTKYMLEIFKNYKVEVKEFLASDPTLLQEIEYDARQESAETDER